MKCNNCNSENFTFFSNPACFFSKEPLSVVKCNNCGLVFLNPRPDKSLGLEYFENAYSNANGFENINYYRDDEQLFERNKIRFELIKGLRVPNQKVLDFGAGQGHFVKTVLDKAWEAFGVEISEAGRQNSKMNFGIELSKSIKELSSNNFGIITLWDVIEHLEDPKGTLMELSKYLHPNGLFIIETSNINSLNYLIHKNKWSYWHIDHFYYYSRESLNYLFDTLNFQPVELNSNPNNNQVSTTPKMKKYKALINREKLLMALKMKYFSYRFKDFEKKSLMTVAFQKTNK